MKVMAKTELPNLVDSSHPAKRTRLLAAIFHAAIASLARVTSPRISCSVCLHGAGISMPGATREITSSMLSLMVDGATPRANDGVVCG